MKIGDIHISDNESYLTTIGKGSKVRDVYFNGVLSEQLQEYIEVKKAWGHPTQATDYLFSHRGGKRYTTVALFHSVKEALAVAGLPVSCWEGKPGHKRAPWEGGRLIPGFHPHSLRHSFATHTLAASNDLRFTQKQLGHSAISMTALYADVEPQRRQQLANKLEY
jgi:site-specific recombinase XerD